MHGRMFTLTHMFELPRRRFGLGATLEVGRAAGPLTASAAAATLKAEAAAWNEPPPYPLNDANDITKAAPYVLLARKKGRPDDWILAALRNRGYALNVIQLAFNLSGGFKGANTDAFKDTAYTAAEQARNTPPPGGPVKASEVPWVWIGAGALVLVAVIAARR